MDGLKRARIKRGAQRAQATKIWNEAELLINGETNEVNIEKLRVILATYDAKIELLRKLDETVSDLIEDEKGLETEIVEADDYLTELTKKRYTIEFFINQSTIHSNSLASPMATTTPQNGHEHESKALERFWNLESIGILPDEITTHEDKFVKEYQDSSIRLVNGRYCAKLPWKPNHDPLPTNEAVARGRTRSTLQEKCPVTDPNENVVSITKRDVLRASSKIYDPLGLITPITIRAKIFLQELWELKYAWDEPLPKPLIEKWVKLSSDLEAATQTEVQRRYFPLLSSWPSNVFCLDEDQETSKVTAEVTDTSTNASITQIIPPTKSSDLQRLLRTTAWVLRFVNTLQKGNVFKSTTTENPKITIDENLDAKNPSTNPHPADVIDQTSSRPVRAKAGLAKEKLKQWTSILSRPPEDVEN
ncbi:Hypothetical predicted protein [Paramuricea clavata]|uniref:Uncharacterized protein n=1 Tax=Paramuricea clavata TaxID=317549 RepID=A0A7D9D880_PARCT|nr:Hypothetical predicted protein [Paramuricea clavata]